MGQVLHGSARPRTSSFAIRRSKAPLKDLAPRYGLTRKREEVKLRGIAVAGAAARGRRDFALSFRTNDKHILTSGRGKIIP